MSQTARHVYRDITAMFQALIVPQGSVRRATSVLEDPTLQGISYSRAVVTYDILETRLYLVNWHIT